MDPSVLLMAVAVPAAAYVMMTAMSKDTEAPCTSAAAAAGGVGGAVTSPSYPREEKIHFEDSRNCVGVWDNPSKKTVCFEAGYPKVVVTNPTTAVLHMKMPGSSSRVRYVVLKDPNRNASLTFSQIVYPTDPRNPVQNMVRYGYVSAENVMYVQLDGLLPGATYSAFVSGTYIMTSGEILKIPFTM